MMQAGQDWSGDDGRISGKRLFALSAGGIAPLNLHHLPFERVKGKPATDNLKNVEDFPALQQNDTPSARYAHSA
jgi:hypothetical protein